MPYQVANNTRTVCLKLYLQLFSRQRDKKEQKMLSLVRQSAPIFTRLPKVISIKWGGSSVFCKPLHKHSPVPRAVEVAMLHVSGSYAKSMIVGVWKKNKESSDHLYKLRWFIMPIAVKWKKKPPTSRKNFKRYALEKISRMPAKGRKGNCNCGERWSPWSRGCQWWTPSNIWQIS